MNQKNWTFRTLLHSGISLVPWVPRAQKGLSSSRKGILYKQRSVCVCVCVCVCARAHEHACTHAHVHVRIQLHLIYLH